MPSWQRDFASGLIILVPLLVTLIFLVWIYSYLARVPIPTVSGPIRVLLTLVIFILLSFSVGYLMRTAMGTVMESALDDLMNQLPGLRVIYNASKMAVETALGGTDDLQKPVRLEVWDGLRMTAFKTGNRAPDGREILFLPTAPNITTGFVIEVEEDRYVEIDDTVEDALTRLLSAGFGNNDDDAVSDMFGRRPTDTDREEIPISAVDDAATAAASEEGAGKDATGDGADPPADAVEANGGSETSETDGTGPVDDVDATGEPAESEGMPSDRED